MNIRTKAISTGIAASTILPLVAFAQTSDLSFISGALSSLQGIVDSLIPFLIGVAVVVFIWGVIKYVSAGDDPEKAAAARQLMIYGIIALFVIVSIWGLVTILQNLTGTSGTTTIPLPTVGP